MAEEITLSVMQQRVGDVGSVLRPLLDEFEAETRIHVNLQTLDWSTGLDQLLQNTLRGHGPDVSEIGTTWVSSFVAMNSLQPFLASDMRTIGTRSDFLPAAWQTGIVEGGHQVWTMPWMMGMRAALYRQDLFEAAGVDPKEAFKTHNAMMDAFETLQAQGVSSPWGVPTQTTINTLHYIANWIWTAGGDFVSADGKSVRFTSPESLDGIKKYFQLARFLPKPSSGLDVERIGDLFWQEGKIAATIGGPWQLSAYQESASPVVSANIQIAPLPGTGFLGGSNLVVWEYVRNKMAAVRLVGFLTGKKVQAVYPPHTGLYPVRRESLAAAPYTDDPIYQELAANFITAKAYPAVSLWGIIERRLPVAFAEIWLDILENPSADLDSVIQKHLNPLAKRLEITLHR